jgi:hypothetical protein
MANSTCARSNACSAHASRIDSARRRQTPELCAPVLVRVEDVFHRWPLDPGWRSPPCLAVTGRPVPFLRPRSVSSRRFPEPRTTIPRRTVSDDHVNHTALPLRRGLGARSAPLASRARERPESSDRFPWLVSFKLLLNPYDHSAIGHRVDKL